MQAAFTEEGLSKLWNELAKDGEISTVGGNKDKKDDEGGGGNGTRGGGGEELGEKKSPFDALLEEWTWGQVGGCGCEDGPVPSRLWSGNETAVKE